MYLNKYSFATAVIALLFAHLLLLAPDARAQDAGSQEREVDIAGFCKAEARSNGWESPEDCITYFSCLNLSLASGTKPHSNSSATNPNTANPGSDCLPAPEGTANELTEPPVVLMLNSDDYLNFLGGTCQPFTTHRTPSQHPDFEFADISGVLDPPGTVNFVPERDTLNPIHPVWCANVEIEAVPALRHFHGLPRSPTH